ncbi:hypothetical protein [Rhodococcus sp. KRD162]|uniref:hypothetical protein n=1 Tax=Rhodococcus sp. KRD162 TaxID=2729725 RepID=UPI0019D2442B|nr:hypothetical protein [Rhodococcus sp. KRD162]
MTENELVPFVALAVSLDEGYDDAWTLVLSVAAEHPDLSGRAFADAVRDKISAAIPLNYVL